MNEKPGSGPDSNVPEESDNGRSSAGRQLKKTLVMYAVMVTVSTSAIFVLEHATLSSAFRTALVAAVGKTFAANWVSSFFD